MCSQKYKKTIKFSTPPMDDHHFGSKQKKSSKNTDYGPSAFKTSSTNPPPHEFGKGLVTQFHCIEGICQNHYMAYIYIYIFLTFCKL